MPEILPENMLAFDLFKMVCNQHIMGFGGPVDLNFSSLDFVMKIYNVAENQKAEIFEKVYTAYRSYLGAIRKKSEEEKES